jgi:hypothetical protein
MSSFNAEDGLMPTQVIQVLLPLLSFIGPSDTTTSITVNSKFTHYFLRANV